MKLSNPFSTETRWLFFDRRYTCSNCGGNGQDCGGTELHHILGRCSSSPLNACVLCKGCHSEEIHTDEQKAKFLQQTLRYLLKIDYQFTEYDLQFYRDNEKLYNY